MFELLVLAQLETSGFDLTTHSFTQRSGLAHVTLTIHNRTHRDARRVFVDCAIMDKDGRPQAIAKELISNVGAGQRVHGEAKVAAFKGMASADCRVTQVTFAR